ncbi:hypothetical protein P7C71_g3605, partial [Lecanoromycetidae sp. Uapishka_2]
MATYPGRKGINVSQYVAGLNAIASPNDVVGKTDNDLNLDDDLARFTNTDFLDYDAQDFFDASQLPEYDAGQEERARRENAAANSKFDAKEMNFGNDPFHFTGISSYMPTDQAPTISTALPTSYVPNGSISATSYTSPTFPSTTSPITYNALPRAGQKHQLSASPDPSFSALAGATTQEVETPASRHAAEEDKRRRNTAASARFRVKKKQREQALEQTAKELENEVGGLKQRIGQLEAENDFLRGLVVAKDGGDKSELRVRWDRFGKGEGDRKGSESKKGVGTEEDEA